MKIGDEVYIHGCIYQIWSEGCIVVKVGDDYFAVSESEIMTKSDLSVIRNSENERGLRDGMADEESRVLKSAGIEPKPCNTCDYRRACDQDGRERCRR